MTTIIFIGLILLGACSFALLLIQAKCDIDNFIHQGEQKK